MCQKAIQAAGWQAVWSHTTARIKDTRKTIRTIGRVAEYPQNKQIGVQNGTAGCTAVCYRNLALG